MVYISQNQKDFGNRLMSLLYILFKKSAHAAEKKKVLRESYDVDLDADEMKEVDDMCNLSTGVFNRGREEGEVIGVNKVIVQMLQNKMDIELISQNTDRSVEYIRKLAKQENISCS